MIIVIAMVMIIIITGIIIITILGCSLATLMIIMIIVIIKSITISFQIRSVLTSPLPPISPPRL